MVKEPLVVIFPALGPSYFHSRCNTYPESWLCSTGNWLCRKKDGGEAELWHYYRTDQQCWSLSSPWGPFSPLSGCLGIYNSHCRCPSVPSRPVPIAQGLRPWLHLGYHQGVERLPNDEAGDLLFTSRLSDVIHQSSSLCAMRALGWG